MRRRSRCEGMRAAARVGSLRQGRPSRGRHDRSAVRFGAVRGPADWWSHRPGLTRIGWLQRTVAGCRGWRYRPAMSRRPRPAHRRARRRARPPWLVALVALVAQVVFVALPASAAGASIADTVAIASVTPRVFFPNGDGFVDSTRLHYELSRPATVSVSIRDLAGRAISSLRGSTGQATGAYNVVWNGRNSTGGLVPDAGYRFRLTVANGLGTFSVDRWVTKARH